MILFISFGQTHTHRINGQTYDCDSLLEVEYPDEMTARLALNRELKRWCGIYTEKDLQDTLSLFPKGILNKGNPVTF